MTLKILMILCTIGLLLVSSVFDIKKKKIPNFITFPAIFLGLILTGIGMSANELLFRILGITVLFVLSTLRFLGMGDIKLIMAIIALRGIKTAFAVLACGLILSIIVWIIRRGIFALKLIQQTLNSLMQGSFYITHKEEKAPFAPYAFAAYLLLIIFKKAVVQ